MRPDGFDHRGALDFAGTLAGLLLLGTQRRARKGGDGADEIDSVSGGH